MSASDKPSRVVIVNPPLTPEVFETWTRARDAIEKISQETDVQSIGTLYLNWLRGNALRSAAGTFTNAALDGSGGVVSEIAEIPGECWNHLTGDFLNDTESVQFDLRDSRLGELYGIVRCFGMRFEPNGLAKLIAQLPKKRSIPKPQVPADHVEIAPAFERESVEAVESKGPLVTDPLLAAWYDVYKRAYPGPADTEDIAMKSATGMFPGKSVTRAKVRKLRGAGALKRGRKSSNKD